MIASATELSTATTKPDAAAEGGDAGPSSPNPPSHPTPFPPPDEIINKIMNLGTYPQEVAEKLGLTLSEFQSYLDFPEFQNYLQLTLRLEQIRQQVLAAQRASLCLHTLDQLASHAKPEIARRCATTILTIAGLIPPKTPAPKPWEKPAITKQHLPTYNNPTPAVKPGTSVCRGPETPEPARPPTPTEPLPDSSSFSVPRSSFIVHRSPSNHTNQ